jgi:hypothetical protein
LDIVNPAIADAARMVRSIGAAQPMHVKKSGRMDVLAGAGGIEPFEKCLWHKGFSNRHPRFDSIFDSFRPLLARMRSPSAALNCRLVGVERKLLANLPNGAFDPQPMSPTSMVDARSTG